MPRFFRKLEKPQKGPWNDLRPEFSNFLENSDFRLGLLRGWLEDNPSIWKMDDDDILKEEIFFAIFDSCRSSEDIFFLSFDESIITTAGLAISNTPGNTKITAVDNSKRHFEISNFTAQKSIKLILEIIRSDFQIVDYKKSKYDTQRTEKYNRSSQIFNITTPGQGATETPIVTTTGSGTDLPPAIKIQQSVSLLNPNETGNLIDPTTLPPSSKT